MCLAIVIPAGREINREHLLQGWQGNPNGAGFAYSNKGKVVVSKGYMKLQDFLVAFDKTRKKNPESAFLVHFRIRSMGDMSPENTHPFSYKYGAMVHNGTITGTAAKFNEGKSDTCLFLEKFGDHFSKEFLLKQKDELASKVGYNKLAFLFHDGSYAIVNEKLGEWSDNIWYSNGGFKPRTHWPAGPHRDMYDD